MSVCPQLGYKGLGPRVRLRLREREIVVKLCSDRERERARSREREREREREKERERERERGREGENKRGEHIVKMSTISFYGKAGGGKFVSQVCVGTSNTPDSWYNPGEGGGTFYSLFACVFFLACFSLRVLLWSYIWAGQARLLVAGHSFRSLVVWFGLLDRSEEKKRVKSMLS